MSAESVLYLASASPRRRELLQQLGFEPQRIVAPIDETRLAAETPRQYVERLAREKAAAGWHMLQQAGLPAHPVLAADTTVALGDEIFGKPVDAADARAMLLKPSGTTHEVLTAVAVRLDARTEVVLSVSQVTFAPLTDGWIDAYIATGEPFDKAGGYGIQGLAGLFAQRLDGSFTGVMGLPLFETGRLLAAFGLDPLTRRGN